MAKDRNPYLPRATLHAVDGADYGFDVPVRSGRNDQKIVAEIALSLSKWIERLDD